MQDRVLNKKMSSLKDLLKKFNQDFGLVGGTAIALYLGHRRSVDFDLFTNKKFNNSKIRETIIKAGYKIQQTFLDEKDQYIALVNGVQLTFLYFPFFLKFVYPWEDIIKTPKLVDLCALKAYTLGRRNEWKDYVDLYYCLKSGIKLTDLHKAARRIFKDEFNEKMFKSQLSYFKDIDLTYEIDYLPGKGISNKKIMQELKKASLE